MGKQRDMNWSIETLRGVAIVLVVVGHVIGSGPDGGMKIDYPSPFRYLYLYIDYIQMPLFTAIAGYAYSYRPVSLNDKVAQFFKKKVMRLLVPMVVVGTLYFLVQYIVPGTNNKGDISEIWRIYVFPFTIYWYLPSLFLIFVIQVLAEKCFKHLYDSTANIIIYLAATCLIMSLQATYIIPDSFPNYFSFKGALLQLPYFVTGVLLCRIRDKNLPNWYTKFSMVIIIVGLILLNSEWFYPLAKYNIYNCIRPLFIIITLIMVMRIKWENRFFIRVGASAYAIYLFHVFFTGGVRIILVKLGMESQLGIFSITLIMALCLSMVIDYVVTKSKWLSLFILGKSVR